MNSTIAIIGAGMAGLSCAAALAAAGHRPVLFDKGRGPGGRMATRRAEVEGQTIRFDHGAQYFTARDPRFMEAVAQWRDAGVAADWPAAGADAVVGTPAMNAPIRHLAEALDVHWGTRIETVVRDGNRWLLRAGEDIFHADQVVCAIPAEQAAELLRDAAPDYAARAAAVRSQPCWALMVRFAAPIDLPDTFKGTDVAWAARNSAKPGRGDGENWVIHGSPHWSQGHLELEPGEVGELLLERFFSETGETASTPVHTAAHRWRYAMVGKADGPPALWDAGSGLGACGDWLSGPRIENAWLSGRILADLVTA